MKAAVPPDGALLADSGASAWGFRVLPCTVPDVMPPDFGMYRPLSIVLTCVQRHAQAEALLLDALLLSCCRGDSLLITLRMCNLSSDRSNR